MKILVTGGAGFIGSHIADAYLELGHEVVIIDNLSTGSEENINRGARFIRMDINDPKLVEVMKDEKFNLVNHQAAQIDVRISVGNPRYDAEINILGALNLYESALASGVKKIVFASSGGAIYGDQEYFPADEEHPLRPCSPYGIAKLVNERYLDYYKMVYGIDFVALRYGNVYGPRQSFKGEAGVIAIFINKMLNGEQAIINGDGQNTRDYLCVYDVVKANKLALKENCSGIFNIGTGIETDVNYIFNSLKNLLEFKGEEIHGPAKTGEQRRSVISYSKLQSLHGWKPDFDLDSGLKLTSEYFMHKHNSK